MKLKICSLLMAVSMAMTSFVASVSAANVTTTNPKYVLTTAGELTDWTGYESLQEGFDWSPFEEEYNADYKTYIIDVKLTGAAYSTTVTGSKTKKLSGASIIGAKINATFDSEASYEDDYVYGIASALASYTGGTPTAAGIMANYTGTAALSPSKSAGSKTITANDSSDAVYQLIVTVDASKPVTVNVEGEVYFDEFTNDIAGSGTASKVVAAKGSITLPLVEKEEDDGKGVEVKDGDAVIGTVWNNVVFEDVANTAYNLIFTDAEGNVKPGEGDIDFGELSGDVTVAVILNSARAGVTLQVVPVE